MKKYLAIALAVLMLVAAFAGCAGGKKNAGGKAYGTFRDYSTAIPTTMNWLITTDTAATTVLSYCSIYPYMDRIIEGTNGWEWTLELASQFPKQLDEEGKLWEIKIRKDFKWANGDKVTIDDLIYTMQMCVDPLQQNLCSTALSQNTYCTIKNIYEYLMGEVSSWDEVGVKKIDDYTMHIETTDPTVSINVQRMINLKLIYKPLYEKCMNEDRTASTYGSDLESFMSGGPFILTEWEKDAKVVLKRNPDYVFPDEIKIEAYEFRQVPDTNTALQLFENGELDKCSLSYNQWEGYEDDPRVFEYFNDSLMYFWTNLGNPTQKGIFSNKDYLDAIYYGTDRQKIADTLGVYTATRLVRKAVIGDPRTGTAFVDMEQDFVPTAAEAFDLEKAKTSFNKALEKCKLEKVKMRIIFSDTATHIRGAAEIMQKMYAEHFDNKLTVEFQVVPTAHCYSLRRWNPSNPTAFDSALGSATPSANDPRQTFSYYTSTYSPPRYKYSNPEYDAMYATVMNLDLESENDKIIAACLKMEEMILNDRVAIPVYERPEKTVFHERVTLPADGYITGFGFGTRWATISE